MTDDAELLRRYADEVSEVAFAELVQRHLGLVYGAALRQLDGDAHQAREVAQTIFIDVARKASSLRTHPALASWLHTSTRYAARKVRRTEGRRAHYERELQVNPEPIHAVGPTVDWTRLQPLIDELVQALNERDRETVLLRFFEGRGFAEIGATFQVSEDGARKRVDRALDKLRELLAQRGVTSTTAALGLALEGNAIAAPPLGLAGVVTGSAVAAATSGAAGLLGFMSSIKLAPTISVVAALASLGAAWLLEQENRATVAALATATAQNAAAATRLEALQQKARVAAQATTAFQRALDERRSVAADTARMPAVAPKPTMTGEAFLAAHPEAQRMVDALNGQSFEITYAPGLQALGLTPEERARITAEVSKMMQLNSNMGGVVFALNRPAVEPALGENGAEVFAKLQALLGEERYQRYIEARRWEELNTLVRGVATSFHGSDTPLPPEQAQAVIEILKRNGTNRGDGRMRHGIAVNWPAAVRELAPVVTPAQLAALSAAHTSALGQRSLVQYHEEVTSTSAAAKSNSTK